MLKSNDHHWFCISSEGRKGCDSLVKEKPNKQHSQLFSSDNHLFRSQQLALRNAVVSPVDQDPTPTLNIGQTSGFSSQIMFGCESPVDQRELGEGTEFDYTLSSWVILHKPSDQITQGNITGECSNTVLSPNTRQPEAWKILPGNQRQEGSPVGRSCD